MESCFGAFNTMSYDNFMWKCASWTLKKEISRPRGIFVIFLNERDRSRKGNFSNAFWLSGGRRPEICDFQTICGSYFISVDFCLWAIAEGRGRPWLDMLRKLSKVIGNCKKWIFLLLRKAKVIRLSSTNYGLPLPWKRC